MVLAEITTITLATRFTKSNGKCRVKLSWLKMDFFIKLIKSVGYGILLAGQDGAMLEAVL